MVECTTLYFPPCNTKQDCPALYTTLLLICITVCDAVIKLVAELLIIELEIARANTSKEVESRTIP
ncbi:MAG: hypothetical protein BWY22_02597 [Bacteroidetes bacterium ADurb.Bin217]|nr:MAG: hypothetical protein BWY22_02597 [Bacteroidetes bacterium ADurb.Bin217]